MFGFECNAKGFGAIVKHFKNLLVGEVRTSICVRRLGVIYVSVREVFVNDDFKIKFRAEGAKRVRRLIHIRDDILILVCFNGAF